MNNLIIGILAMAACICFYLLKSKKDKYTKIVWSVYAVLLCIASYFFIDKVVYRFSHPEVWDFTCFYLYGKVAATGHNFYLPENFSSVFNSGGFPVLDYKSFNDYVVNVGFPYPPPSILYFVPLGFLSYNNALIWWTIFSLLFVAGCIYLIYSMFLKKENLNGLLLIIILFFIFSPVRATIFYSQTNFILLFYLLLMKKYADTKYAGIFLALAIFTKPYMIVFAIFFVLIKNWKALLYFIVTCLLLCVGTALLFGTTIFTSYIFNNPSKRLPAGVFFEQINQSLHSILLRANIITLDKPLLFICITGILMIVTLLYLIYLQKRKLYDYIWATLLLMGLLVYPGTLSHYLVLLLFIIFQFFGNKNSLGFDIYITVPIIGVFYVLSNISAFAAICFLLGIIILKAQYFIKNSSKINLSQPT